MTTLVLAESSQGQLLETTKRLIKAAGAFNGPIDVLILDRPEHNTALKAAGLAGVKLVHVADYDEPDLVGFDETATLALALGDDYNVIIAANTGRGKHILPQLAARLHIAPVTGVSAILDDQTIERPIYAGSLVEQLQLNTKKILLTIRTANFSPVGDQPPCPIEPISSPVEGSLIEIVEQTRIKNERPNLADARIVVAGGRGLGSKEKFAQLEGFADALGAALGASRIAVDMGWAPHILQVGQTGVQVAPDLYIALGISGAVQHIAGIKDAGKIIAINKDREATIFKVADYGIIGDLENLLPELQNSFVDDN
jgi:electron transfer flavoprotein alpha subunit